jgi:hypothetical protein
MPTLALALDDAASDGRHSWRQRGPQRPAGQAGGGGAGRPGQDDFYELLGVPRDASPELIKRQYYILARRWAACCGRLGGQRAAAGVRCIASACMNGTVWEGSALLQG